MNRGKECVGAGEDAVVVEEECPVEEWVEVASVEVGKRLGAIVRSRWMFPSRFTWPLPLPTSVTLSEVTFPAG